MGAGFFMSSLQVREGWWGECPSDLAGRHDGGATWRGRSGILVQHILDIAAAFAALRLTSMGAIHRRHAGGAIVNRGLDLAIGNAIADADIHV
ncbi:hypothetical protein DFP90_111100 [Aestuariispira insulae]|uniref:Uncharacterized protein n=1 Tax=Aestuariispira insulae TaxID=1461337 RepID=A0A3D9H8N0_9PROT|nr:hypothetical protein DFP90_111100 [Aestuariispira insulae]